VQSGEPAHVQTGDIIRCSQLTMIFYEQ
jgi:hypothetical protein